jgi:hypothetical protein
MKKIIIALMLISGSASAEQWMVSKNKDGGDIVLTGYSSKDCEDYQRRMYIAAVDGTAFYGCWSLLNEKFHIRMDSGERAIYDLNGWKLKGEK